MFEGSAQNCNSEVPIIVYIIIIIVIIITQYLTEKNKPTE